MPLVCERILKSAYDTEEGGGKLEILVTELLYSDKSPS